MTGEDVPQDGDSTRFQELAGRISLLGSWERATFDLPKVRSSWPWLVRLPGVVSFNPAKELEEEVKAWFHRLENPLLGRYSSGRFRRDDVYGCAAEGFYYALLRYKPWLVAAKHIVEPWVLCTRLRGAPPDSALGLIWVSVWASLGRLRVSIRRRILAVLDGQGEPDDALTAILRGRLARVLTVLHTVIGLPVILSGASFVPVPVPSLPDPFPVGRFSCFVDDLSCDQSMASASRVLVSKAREGCAEAVRLRDEGPWDVYLYNRRLLECVCAPCLSHLISPIPALPYYIFNMTRKVKDGIKDQGLDDTVVGLLPDDMHPGNVLWGVPPVDPEAAVINREETVAILRAWSCAVTEQNAEKARQLVPLLRLISQLKHDYKKVFLLRYLVSIDGGGKPVRFGGIHGLYSQFGNHHVDVVPDDAVLNCIAASIVRDRSTGTVGIDRRAIAVMAKKPIGWAKDKLCNTDKRLNELVQGFSPTVQADVIAIRKWLKTKQKGIRSV